MANELSFKTGDRRPAGSVSTMAYSAEEFWEFGKEFYARPGVERACMSLQHRRLADVNILLICLWLSGQQVELSGPLFGEIDSAVSNWRDTITRALQKCRKQLPQFVGRMPDEFRNAVKKAIKVAESEAERASQARMIDALNNFPIRPTSTEPRELATVSLRVYLRRLATTQDVQDKADIDALVAVL